MEKYSTVQERSWVGGKDKARFLVTLIFIFAWKQRACSDLRVAHMCRFGFCFALFGEGNQTRSHNSSMISLHSPKLVNRQGLCPGAGCITSITKGTPNPSVKRPCSGGGMICSNTQTRGLSPVTLRSRKFSSEPQSAMSIVTLESTPGLKEVSIWQQSQRRTPSPGKKQKKPCITSSLQPVLNTFKLPYGWKSERLFLPIGYMKHVLAHWRNSHKTLLRGQSKAQHARQTDYVFHRHICIYNFIYTLVYVIFSQSKWNLTDSPSNEVTGSVLYLKMSINTVSSKQNMWFILETGTPHGSKKLIIISPCGTGGQWIVFRINEALQPFLPPRYL